MAFILISVASRGATISLSPGQSIQKAIDQSTAGDAILLEDGVYHGSLNIHKSITLRRNTEEKAPHRPAWPEELDKRWGGLEAGPWSATASNCPGGP